MSAFALNVQKTGKNTIITFTETRGKTVVEVTTTIASLLSGAGGAQQRLEQYAGKAGRLMLRALCVTLARQWQSDRDRLQGVFLHSIARLLARQTTHQTAPVRLTADYRELCRGSLAMTGVLKIVVVNLQQGYEEIQAQMHNLCVGSG